MKKQIKKTGEQQGTRTKNEASKKKDLKNEKTDRKPVKGVEDPLKKNEEQYFPEEEIENQPGKKRQMPEEVPTPRPHMPK